MTNNGDDHGAPERAGRSSNRVKYITTFAVYYCTFSFGCSFTFLSPTVLDFKDKFDSNVQTVSIVFTILTAAYLFGALLCGILMRLLQRPFVVIFLLSCMCGSLFVIPYLPNLTLFFILSFVLGFGAGGYDTAQVAWVIDIWRERSEPFILGQHFAYSIGTVVPPLLLGPFLTGKEEDDEEGEKMTTTRLTTLTYPEETSTVDIVSTTAVLDEESTLYIPFMIVGGVALVAVMVQLILYFKLNASSSSKLGEKNENLVNLDKVEKEVEEVTELKDKRRTIILIILSCLVIASYQGMELTTMQFLPTFSVYSKLKLSKSEGADILFGLTLAFAVCRGLGILVVLKVRPHFILCGNFILLTAANCILLFSAQNSRLWLWTASVLFGAGMSTVYGGFYAYIQRHLYVTNTVAAIVAVSGGLVAAIYPLIVGESVERDPSILCYVNFFSIVVLIGSFGVTYWFTMIRKNVESDQKDAYN